MVDEAIGEAGKTLVQQGKDFGFYSSALGNIGLLKQ